MELLEQAADRFAPAEEVSRTDSPEPPPSQGPRMRWLYNPWVVTTGATVLGGLILALIFALR